MNINKAHRKIVACLKDLASKGSKITYARLSYTCNLGYNMSNPYERLLLSSMLGEILREETTAGRPPICVIVIRDDTNQPGHGWFSMMDELDLRLPGEDDLAMFSRAYNEVLAYYTPTRQSADSTM